MRRAVGVALVLPALACAAPPSFDDAAPPARAIVLGADDSITVRDDGANLPGALVAHMDAVGRVQGPACTATHIGDRRVLTAGHCVTARSNDACETTSFEWTVRAEPAVRIVGRCVRVRFAAFAGGVDLALVEVDHAPTVAAPVDACRAVAPGAEVSLLGFPERGPLRWTGYCSLVADVPARPAPTVGHTCDTREGSSGSPLFRRDDGALVAVHLGAGGDGFNRAIPLAPYAEQLALPCGVSATPP